MWAARMEEDKTRKIHTKVEKPAVGTHVNTTSVK